MIVDFFFWLFAAVLLISAALVVTSKNPVHSVLFLILSFFNAAALFLIAGAEFLAMILVIVYVGAVAVLFLFVVMMLNIDFEELREGFLRYLPLGAAVAVVIFTELLSVFYMSLNAPSALAPARQAIPAITNTKAIGNVLYTWYLYPFQLSGL